MSSMNPLSDLAALGVITSVAGPLALIADRQELQNPGRELPCTGSGHFQTPMVKRARG